MKERTMYGEEEEVCKREEKEVWIGDETEMEWEECEADVVCGDSGVCGDSQQGWWGVKPALEYEED